MPTNCWQFNLAFEWKREKYRFREETNQRKLIVCVCSHFFHSNVLSFSISDTAAAVGEVCFVRQKKCIACVQQNSVTLICQAGTVIHPSHYYDAMIHLNHSISLGGHFTFFMYNVCMCVLHLCHLLWANGYAAPNWQSLIASISELMCNREKKRLLDRLKRRDKLKREGTNWVHNSRQQWNSLAYQSIGVIAGYVGRYFHRTHSDCAKANGKCWYQFIWGSLKFLANHWLCAFRHAPSFMALLPYLCSLGWQKTVVRNDNVAIISEWATATITTSTRHCLCVHYVCTCQRRTIEQLGQQQ